MRLKTIKKVFSLFANSALKAYETKITPFLFFESLIFEYEYMMIKYEFCSYLLILVFI